MVGFEIVLLGVELSDRRDHFRRFVFIRNGKIQNVQLMLCRVYRKMRFVDINFELTCNFFRKLVIVPWRSFSNQKTFKYYGGLNVSLREILLQWRDFTAILL